MNQLRQHKWHYCSLAIIFVFFLLSVQVRKEKLSLPLSTDHEWVTAHTLITLQVWKEEGGPQHFNFNPVYSYNGKGNEAVGNLGGVMGKDSRLYYTSYPPFSFIFAYYGSKILGGPDLSNLRTLGLLMHFFCAILIYLIIVKLRTEKKDRFSIAGILGAALYLFSAGALWMHSIMYFADTCVQMFLLLAAYQVLRLLTQDYTKPGLFFISLSLVFFICTYTEWLGLFFGMVVASFLIIKYWLKKNKAHLKGFLFICAGCIFALILTLIQYGSINGLSALIEVSIPKYIERGGFAEPQPGKTVYNWSNQQSFDLIESNLNRNFAMAINLLGISIFLLLPILIFRKFRNNIQSLHLKIWIPVLLFLAVLLHYLLFFNFNAIHNISNLKTGLLMILFTAVVVLIIEETLKTKYKLLLSTILLVIMIPRTLIDIEKFNGFYSPEKFDQHKALSAELISELHSPDKYVFANIYVTPEYIYKAHHNVFQLNDTSNTKKFMDYFQADEAQFFYHVQNKPLYMLELERKNDIISVKKRISFDE